MDGFYGSGYRACKKGIHMHACAHCYHCLSSNANICHTEDEYTQRQTTYSRRGIQQCISCEELLSKKGHDCHIVLQAKEASTLRELCVQRWELVCSACNTSIRMQYVNLHLRLNSSTYWSAYNTKILIQIRWASYTWKRGRNDQKGKPLSRLQYYKWVCDVIIYRIPSQPTD